ncbi:MAG: hypothetical protein ACLP36_01325 [Acidimicrobiales bacterium]
MAPRPLAPLSAAVLVTAMLLSAVPASASSWTVALRAASAGEAQTQAAPAAPTGVSDACVSSSVREVIVTWNAVTDASSYSIFKSTTTSAGSYSSTATGVTGTSWTSGTLAAGNVYFKVEAYVGTKWVSAESAATGETTLSTSNPECTQP